MDFFLEPFPVGSGLGIIEACQYGAIPLFGKHPVKLCSTFEVFHDEIQQIFNPLIVGLDQSEQLKYYLAQSDADKILFKEKFKTLIQEQHCGDGWKSALLKGCNNTATDQILKQVDILIKEEAIFFQTYMKKNDKELLAHLLGLKKIIGRRLLLVLLFSPKIKISLFSFLSDNRGRFIHRMIFG